MANIIIDDAHVELGATDVSDMVTKVTVKSSKDVKENTAMGADGITRLLGLSDFSIDVEFNQDFAASELDSVLWTLFSAGAAFTFKVRATSAAKGTSNPEFTGSVLMPEYTPLDAGVGDNATTKVSLVGTGGFTRATS